MKSDTLTEIDCSLTIIEPDTVACATRLKMDIAGAKYRLKPNSTNDKRMCDFGVALSTEESGLYFAVELKSREPYLEDAAEQLEQGLRTIMEHLIAGRLRPTLRALLVVGDKSPRLLRHARTAQGRLSVDGRTVQIEIVDCHSVFRI